MPCLSAFVMIQLSQKGVLSMGMADKQFQSWVRFLLGDLRDMDEETDPEKKAAKLAEIMENLQKTLED